MPDLDDVIVLDERVSIYVPSTMDATKQLSDADAALYTRVTAKFLAAQFGGATARIATADGSWIDDVDNTTLITERVSIVYAYTSKLTDATIAYVLRYVRALKAAMGQQRIAVELGGRLLLV